MRNQDPGADACAFAVVLAGVLAAGLGGCAAPTSAPTELYGAVVVSRVLPGAPLTLHHDRAVARSAASCTP